MTTSLLFDGTLELCDPDGKISDNEYWFETLTGSSFGDPQPVQVAIESLIRDGALTITESDGNREQSFLVKVRGPDSRSLAEGIAALHRATSKRTTLVWTPPDGYSPPTVFRVETSSLQSPGTFDDLAYVKRNEITVSLNLVCLPYSYSVDKITDDAATPPAGGGTVLYNCESTSGWASSAGPGTYAVDSVIFTEGAGSLRSQAYYAYIYDYPTYSTATVIDEVTGLTLSTGAGGYMSVAVRTDWSDYIPGNPTQTGLASLYMQIAGSWVPVPSFIAASRDVKGFVHYVWPVDAGVTVTGLKMTVNQFRNQPFPAAPQVRYDDVELLPAATTDHQIVKQITVKGSARTAGSLHIAAPSDSVALGQVLAITAPSAQLPAGFQPDGRRWITQGSTTTDATALHGSYLTPDPSAYLATTGKPIFDVPVAMLNAGPYMMVGLILVESSPTIAGVQAQLRVGSTNVGPTSTAELSRPGLTAGWQFVTLGTCYLPPLPMQGADASTKVRLLFKGAKFADIFMVPVDDSSGRPLADFSIVDCGTGVVGPGGPSSNLWIDSPWIDQPQGGWWRGPTADRANAQAALPDVKKPGLHELPPGPLTAFLVSTGASGPALGLGYYPAWYGAAAL